MSHPAQPSRALSDAQVQQFIHDGLVRNLARSEADTSPVEAAIWLALVKKDGAGRHAGHHAPAGARDAGA